MIYLAYIKAKKVCNDNCLKLFTQKILKKKKNTNFRKYYRKIHLHLYNKKSLEITFWKQKIFINNVSVYSFSTKTIRVGNVNGTFKIKFYIFGLLHGY